MPLGALFLLAAAISTVLNVNQLLGTYFAAASGNTKQEIQQKTFRPKAMAASAYGAIGNGASKLPSPADLADGEGRPLKVPTPGERLTGYLKDGEDIGVYDGPLARQKRVNTTGANGDRLFLFDRDSGGQPILIQKPGPVPPIVLEPPEMDDDCTAKPELNCVYLPEVPDS